MLQIFTQCASIESIADTGKCVVSSPRRPATGSQVEKRTKIATQTQVNKWVARCEPDSQVHFANYITN